MRSRYRPLSEQEDLVCISDGGSQRGYHVIGSGKLRRCLNGSHKLDGFNSVISGQILI